MLSYLKIYPDLIVKMRKLEPEQQYRLYEAMFDYAFQDITPSFDGVEDFAWSWLKDMVDAAEKELDKKREAGRKGAEVTNTQYRHHIGRTSAEDRQTIGTDAAQYRHDSGTIPAEGRHNTGTTSAPYRQDTGTESAEDRQTIGTGAAIKEQEQEQEQEQEKEQEHEQSINTLSCPPDVVPGPVRDAPKHKPKEDPANEARFEQFWEAYPKVRHQAKPDARKAFDKLKVTDELLQTMLDAIAFQKTTDQWNSDGGRYIPMPSTWLNKRRWEDEPAQAAGQQTFVNPFWASMSGGPIE